MKKLLLCIVLSWVCVSFAGGNLREGRDPGFEEGTRYWRLMTPGDPCAIFSTDGGIGGSGALVVSSPDGETSSGFYAKGFVPIIGGRKYTVEAQFKGEVKSGSAFIAAQLWSGAKGTAQVPGSRSVIKFESPAITECVPNLWSSVHITFTAPAECNAIHLQLATRDFCGVIAFDNIAVYEMDDTISIPQLSRIPVLDGKLDEVFLKEATHFTDFMKFPINVNNGKLAKEQTEVYVGMTTEHIYVAILLHHAPSRELMGHELPRDEQTLFADDSIEFFITQMGDYNSCCHIALNTSGSIYDARDGNTNWNANLEVGHGRIDKGCYLIEFSIPLKELGYNHALDAGIVQLNFKMSFCRNSVGEPDGRYSTWSRVETRFEEPELFRKFKGLGKDFARTCSDRYWKRENERGISEKEVRVCWQIENPLFKELLTGEPHPEQGEGAYIWHHPLLSINAQFGLQYGFTYSRKEILEEYTKHRLHPFTQAGTIAQMEEWDRSTGIGHCLYFPYHIDDWSAPYNEKTYKKMFAEARKTLEQYPDVIWGISLGDEAFEWFLYHFIDNANNPKKLEASPELREAVKTVKEKYGFGKYGVPTSSKGSSKERFEWLATKNYMFERTQQMQRDLYALCQEYKYHGKPIVCISGDPMGGLNVVQQQSRDKDYCDIFTGQVVPVASRWRQNICFTTKVLKDLTGKSVWPCAHVEPYSRSNDAMTTAEYLSEVARGGGSGLQIWNRDYVDSTRGMGDTIFDYYGHRPRWETIMDVVDKFRTMGKLKFPKDDMAIYLSTDTFSCYRTPPADTTEALFTFAGPVAGAWFKFISGTQLRDKELHLNDWKVILLANADVEFVGNQMAFLEYVKNGGTLVCFDANAFSFNEDRSATFANREELFGTKTIEKNLYSGFKFVKDALSAGISEDSCYNISSRYCLEPLPGTRVLARFPTGEVAATIKEYPGGGRAVLFAVSPGTSHVSSSMWRKMMKQFVANLGIKTDHDIWRFQFPDASEWEVEYKYACLTSNFFVWHLNKPFKDRDANADYNGGFYTYTLPPDGDEAGRKYRFPDGNLCNRFKAYEIGDYYNKKNAALVKAGKISTTMFFDTWSKPDSFDIVIDLGREAKVGLIKLIYNGSLPSVTARIDNGATFTAKGTDTDEITVAAVEIEFGRNNLENKKTRHVTLSIPARSANHKLILSEMEIWGNDNYLAETQP